MNSKQFFDGIAKLIDKYGSDAVIAASKRAETVRNRYRYVSRGRNDFRDSTTNNAAKPKKYKDCWITQDYGIAHAGRIFAKIRIECERGLETITTTGDKVTDFIAEFNVNLDEVDFNNFIIDEVQPSLLGSEPEEEEQEIPEGEHRYFVYAWRWCGDERFAKIGRTRNGLKGVKDRMVTTYHPTDDPVLLGVRECADAEESRKTEQYILNRLERTRPDREWVEIDEKFNEMIDKSFMESLAD